MFVYGADSRAVVPRACDAGGRQQQRRGPRGWRCARERKAEHATYATGSRLGMRPAASGIGSFDFVTDGFFLEDRLKKKKSKSGQAFSGTTGNGLDWRPVTCFFSCGLQFLWTLRGPGASAESLHADAGSSAGVDSTTPISNGIQLRTLCDGTFLI
jgi:hypothetical protein